MDLLSYNKKVMQMTASKSTLLLIQNSFSFTPFIRFKDKDLEFEGKIFELMDVVADIDLTNLEIEVFTQRAREAQIDEETKERYDSLLSDVGLKYSGTVQATDSGHFLYYDLESFSSL